MYGALEWELSSQVCVPKARITHALGLSSPVQEAIGVKGYFIQCSGVLRCGVQPVPHTPAAAQRG